MKPTIEQLEAVFDLGNEYGPDFIGLTKVEFDEDDDNLIVKIRLVVYDRVELFRKPTHYRIRICKIRPDGNIDESSETEAYTE